MRRTQRSARELPPYSDLTLPPPRAVFLLQNENAKRSLSKSSEAALVPVSDGAHLHHNYSVQFKGNAGPIEAFWN